MVLLPVKSMDAAVSKNGKYFPMLSRVDIKGSPLNPDQTLEIWGKFDQLPEITRDILTSKDISEKMRFIESEFQLSEDKLCILGSVLREYFLSQKNTDWIHQSITQSISKELSDTLTNVVQQHILTIKPKPTQSATEGEAPKTAQLPLLDAMGTYPKIGEQTITSDRITVRGESGPVRGTVRNWLRAYRDALGVRKHTSMERGQFIFQSDNTRRLAKDERMRLSAILKSLDDKTPLEVHAERQEIQFQIADESTENPRAETNTFQPITSRPAISIAPPTIPSAFQPVGNRLRIASARSQKETASAPKTAKETSEQEESLSSAVYGDIASAPASEDTGFRFSANHILPHEKASALGIDRYRRGPAPQESAKNSPTKNVQSLGTDTFSTEREGRATKPEAAPSEPRKNFGNIVNLRDS